MTDREKKLLYQYYNNYKEACVIATELKKLYKKGRKPNFPECISEFIARQILGGEKAKTGDLVRNGKRIEIKCFASNGPTSFGPDENWDYIALIDATVDSKMTLYFYKISNDCECWKNIKVNKKETFMQQCQQKRRPRINFRQLKEQLPVPNNIVKIDVMRALTEEIVKIEI